MIFGDRSFKTLRSGGNVGVRTGNKRNAGFRIIVATKNLILHVLFLLQNILFEFNH